MCDERSDFTLSQKGKVLNEFRKSNYHRNGHLTNNPNERILVDYNLKKGFHYHVDNEPIVRLEWVSLDETLSFFYEKVHEKFEVLKAVRTGKPNLKPHQISFASLEDITGEFISPRPKLFACLVEKKPTSLYQLAKLLNRDYSNVYKDVKSLVVMGTVKLVKEGKKIKPIPLYDEIVNYKRKNWNRVQNIIVMVLNNSKKEKIGKDPVEMDFLIITDNPGVKEELIEADEEFIKKNLSQNKVLSSAIVGERNKMVILKINKDNKAAKDAMRELQAINITGALSVDKKFVKESEDEEKDDEYGYKFLLQATAALKFRESVKNIYDYLCEINLGGMEEKDLDGIKRTLVMIFRLFDAKCVRETRSKKLIYYCFPHIVRDCKECIANEKLEGNDSKVTSYLMGVQQLFDKKYLDKENTFAISLGHNEEEELMGELIIKDFPNLEVISIGNTYDNFINNKKISKLKIINCPKLRELSCRFQGLAELDVSEFPNLTYLDCQVNKIESLDLSKNTQLRYLCCVNNGLSKLDLSKNVHLTEALCCENHLTNLDLKCFRNPLKVSDIKVSEKIKYFGAYPLVFLVRQEKYYEMERIDISDLNNLVEQLDLKNIEDPKFLGKFISPVLAEAAKGKIIYCFSLRIILDNLANQIKYRCLVFRNRL
ncbi:26515_t:CDS:2, partial [Gigaspora margarita]